MHLSFAWQGVELEDDDDDEDDVDDEDDPAPGEESEPARIVRQDGDLFEIKWRGYPSSENTWQTASDLHDCALIWARFGKEQMELKLLELYRGDKAAYVSAPICEVLTGCNCQETASTQLRILYAFQVAFYQDVAWTMPTQGDDVTRSVLALEVVVQGVHPDWIASEVVGSRHCVPLGVGEKSRLVEPKYYDKRQFRFLNAPGVRYAWRIYTVEGVNSVLGPALVNCSDAVRTAPWLSFLQPLPSHKRRKYIRNGWTVHLGLPLCKSGDRWWICLCERSDKSGVWYLLVELLVPGTSGEPPQKQWVLASDISKFIPVQLAWSFVAKRLSVRCKHVVTDHYIDVIQQFDPL